MLEKFVLKILLLNANSYELLGLLSVYAYDLSYKSPLRRT